MIIAVDFDGTLKVNDTVNVALINNLKRAQRQGNIVILWTCREGKSLVEAVRFLQQHQFRPNYINCNCPEAVKMLGHDSRKVYADVYIDDKSAK